MPVRHINHEHHDTSITMVTSELQFIRTGTCDSSILNSTLRLWVYTLIIIISTPVSGVNPTYIDRSRSTQLVLPHTILHEFAAFRTCVIANGHNESIFATKNRVI